uniref:Uncharacterized protein n=1 Tax=Zea mays TaxID=4577 RepID=B4FCL3_MAIZE|nr:unknown [Zea mays]
MQTETIIEIDRHVFWN